MHLVRVNFKNGVLHEYVFREMSEAESCRKVLSAAQFQNEKCEIWDQAGRHANIDGAQLQAVQLVDIQAEVVGNTRMALFIRSINDQLGTNRDESTASPIRARRVSFDENLPTPSSTNGIGSFSS